MMTTGAYIGDPRAASGDQQRFTQGILARRMSGGPRPMDPQMGMDKLQSFARRVPPERAPQRYGSMPVTEFT